MRQPIVRAGSDGTAPHTDHATICLFCWLHFLSCAGKTSGVFVFRTVGHRRRTGDNFLGPRRRRMSPPRFSPPEVRNVYKESSKEETIWICSFRILEDIFLIFRFCKYSSRTSGIHNSRETRKTGRLRSRIASEMRRVPLRHASFSRIHILITTLWTRSDVGNYTPLYSIFQVIVSTRVPLRTGIRLREINRGGWRNLPPRRNWISRLGPRRKIPVDMLRPIENLGRKYF